MKKQISLQQIEYISKFFNGLADPTRLQILNFLRNGKASVSEIIDATGLKQANTSKQLAVLQTLGFLSREKDGKQAIYSIKNKVIFEICDLVCGHLKTELKEQMSHFK